MLIWNARCLGDIAQQYIPNVKKQIIIANHQDMHVGFTKLNAVLLSGKSQRLGEKLYVSEII